MTEKIQFKAVKFQFNIELLDFCGFFSGHIYLFKQFFVCLVISFW